MAQNYDPPGPTGEEGGAALMVKEGVMDNPKIDAILKFTLTHLRRLERSDTRIVHGGV